MLVGAPTLALVRDAAEVEPIEPLELKGKADAGSRLSAVRVRDVPERRHGELFVGRERELGILGRRGSACASEQRCELVTVVGDAGVGKSRLAAEALASIDATVVRGRCLPYGEGITYWPVVEVLKQLDVRPADEAAAAAIRSLLGETEAATTAEEIAWAFRKTLEQAAAGRPLVVVFDDIQWGEETFLDLVEHVALLSSGASILLFCMARPELAERRPTWPVTLRLEPLGDEDVDELIPQRIPASCATRSRAPRAETRCSSRRCWRWPARRSGDVVVPPTLRALLAARLDQLETAERSVLERGAVEGEIFHRGAVQALAPEEIQVTPRLAALVRKELIRPDRPQLAGEDGFRFRHILIRDAAYDALPKATRADLHQRFAAWLEEHGAELVELDEILAYHLEQTCSYRAELGLPDDDELAAAARRRLTAAGRARASARTTAPRRACSSALPRSSRRASSTSPSKPTSSRPCTGQATATTRSGARNTSRESAAADGDRVAELCGRIKKGTIRLYLEPEGAAREAVGARRAGAARVPGRRRPPRALHRLQRAGGGGDTAAQMDAALEAAERALAHARQAGHLPPESIAARAGGRFFGTTPVSELLAWLDEPEQRAGRDHWLSAFRAGALAMLGRFAEARAILAETRADLAERGAKLELAMITGVQVRLGRVLAGDAAAAAEFGTEACRQLEELGSRASSRPRRRGRAGALCA